MSSMLEQAIIDAAALKEAAVKNAEQEILERYSQDIKEAVNALLEQDLDTDEAEMATGEEVEAEEEVVEQVPLAATEGEPACPCPAEDEVVELDLINLMAQASDEEAEADEMMDREELAEDIVEEEDIIVEDIPEEEIIPDECLIKEWFFCPPLDAIWQVPITRNICTDPPEIIEMGWFVGIQSTTIVNALGSVWLVVLTPM